jgi:hypothetical protein
MRGEVGWVKYCNNAQIKQEHKRAPGCVARPVKISTQIGTITEQVPRSTN